MGSNQNGAELLEGYPRDAGGERRPSAETYLGTVAVFEAAGLREVARRPPSRPIMRREPRAG